jgi:hypothetical protein
MVILSNNIQIQENESKLVFWVKKIKFYLFMKAQKDIN